VSWSHGRMEASAASCWAVLDSLGTRGRWVPCGSCSERALVPCWPRRGAAKRWPPNVTQSDVAAGAALSAFSAAADPALQCFAHELSKGSPLRIGVYGTSVSANNKREWNGPSYPEVLQWLLRARLKSNVSVSTVAFPGMSADMREACLDTLLPVGSADMYFVEEARAVTALAPLPKALG